MVDLIENMDYICAPIYTLGNRIMYNKIELWDL